MARKLSEAERDAIKDIKVLLTAHEVYPTWYNLSTIQEQVKTLMALYVSNIEEPNNEAN